MNLSPSRTSTGCSTRTSRGGGAGCGCPRAKCLDIRQRAAVQNGQLKIVQLDNDVVDAHADQRREQMFGGGDQHALAHQAGGVADLGHVASGRGNLEVVQVGAAEDDAGTGGRGQQPHGDRCAGVEPYARKLKGRRYGLFQVRGLSQISFSGARNGAVSLD